MRAISSAVRRYLQLRHETQKELADAAQVNQATVSRVLRGEPSRAGKATRRLAQFMHEEGFLGTPDEALGALRDTWDGSDEHAAALARLILASKDLWPELGGAAPDGDR
jgi:transcriptional regulator with XRE-family HTH domain